MNVGDEHRVRELMDRAIAAPSPEEFALIMTELRAALQQHIRQTRTLMLASYYSKTLVPREKVLAADAKQRIQARDRNSAKNESSTERIRNTPDTAESQS